jgi:hypothetical protein
VVINSQKSVLKIKSVFLTFSRAHFEQNLRKIPRFLYMVQVGSTPKK